MAHLINNIQDIVSQSLYIVTFCLKCSLLSSSLIKWVWFMSDEGQLRHTVTIYLSVMCYKIKTSFWELETTLTIRGLCGFKNLFFVVKIMVLVLVAIIKEDMELPVMLLLRTTVMGVVPVMVNKTSIIHVIMEVHNNELVLKVYSWHFLPF